MRYVKPDYYDMFQCAAGQCPDTCCAGWEILIDEETLEKYSDTKGAVGSRIANSVDWEEGCFLQYKGRCVLLNEEELCDLILERGEDYLCETCRRYPRHVEEFSGEREFSLSLSCPVAAGLILGDQRRLLLTEEDDLPEPLEDLDDFDQLLYEGLQKARKAMFQIAFDRQETLEQRMERCLRLAGQLQNCLDADRAHDMNDVILRSVQGENIAPEDGETRFFRLKKEFKVFFRLEILRDKWEDVRKEAWNTLYNGTFERYDGIRKQFTEKCDTEVLCENLFFFFLYVYFCGAVYDGRIYSKVAIAVFSTRFIQEFVMCRWYLSDQKAGFESWVEMAYRYAREVEHSDDNLEFLEEWFFTEG